MRKMLSAIAAVITVISLTACGKTQEKPSIPTTIPTVQTEHVHNWENGRCTTCHKSCEHAFVDGVCQVCGKHCTHEWENGECKTCGVKCEHDYKNGKCKICGMVCSHPSHDENQICTTCGSKVPHSFNKMICTICGATPDIYKQKIDNEWLMPSEKKGKIEEKYTLNEKKEPKDFMVYTPYGYDKTQKYDVIFLLHGDGENMHYWMDQKHSNDEITWQMTDLYDNMIEAKKCKPFIAVSLDYQRWRDAYESEDFIKALKTEIMPWIVKHYSTYAESDSVDDIIKARDHFAFGGNDRGAAFTYESVMVDGADLSSNYIIIGAKKRGIEQNYTLNTVDYPFNYVYSGIGSSSVTYYATRIIDNVLKQADYMKDNENAYLNIIGRAEDGWDTWSTCFYNAIQCVF